MGANPHANGGILLKELTLPDFRDYAVQVPKPGAVEAESARVQGEFIRDVLKLNSEARNFRVFSPDETASGSGVCNKARKGGGTTNKYAYI
jgi:xylulose-5-phosphate/fructose-6-phosphate phosphoketolase